jgi:hypothetical protein
MQISLPRPGQLAQVRQRQYLVEGVQGESAETARVDLLGLDDDAQGRRLSVLWGLELGANVIDPKAGGLGSVLRFDDPRFFAANLHALKWNCVTATDASLLQAPFRAGKAVRTAPLASTLAVLYLAVIPGALGYAAWSYVTARAPASVAGSALYLIPAFTMALSKLLLGEVPSAVAIAGGALVLAGVATVHRHARQPSVTPRPVLAVKATA